VLAGLRLQGAAAALPWTRLLLAGWLLNLAWMCSLTLIDGFRTGWVDVLLNPNEYLHDLPRIADPETFMSEFTHLVAFGPGVDGTNVWTTHVAAHPPLATLLFWTLDRIGLGGGFWAGTLCILVASAASVAMPVVLRELGAEAAGRRAVAFVALFPGAVWMAVSADGLFAGVAVSGLALVCLGANRRRPLAGLAGGLLLGAAVYLSYGLVLFGLIVLVALALTLRRHGLRATVWPWLAATFGVVVVAAIHVALGFDWLVGLAQLRVRYYQGIASQRPYAHFVWSNLAAWLVSCSPLLAIGVVGAVTAVNRWHREDWSQDRVLALVALGGLLAALAADVSGMSKAETERIWLTFGVVTYTSVALLRGRQARVALVGAGAWALMVNHLLDTGW
jgi:methylthioxylose transferase